MKQKLQIISFILLFLYVMETVMSSAIPTGTGVGEWAEMPKRVAITFDDGPNEFCTPKLLDGLRERKVRGSFFLLGEQVVKHKELVRRISDEGHLVGNHTYHHVEMKKISRKKARKEIQQTSRVITSITGKEVSFMRPPYGEWEKEMEKDFLLIPILWDVDSLDWTTSDVGVVVENVERNVKDGDIILMHDCYNSSVKAAFRIIDDLKKKGYEFVTVDELIME